MFNTILIISLLIIVLGTITFIKIKNQKGKLLSGVITCLAVVFICLYSFPKLFNSLNYGLDLQGGFEVLYQVSPLDGNDLDDDALYNTYKALLKRIDILGVSEPEITIEGDDKIRVKLAGVNNKEEAREVLSSTATLTFRDVNDKLLMTSDVLGGSAKVTTDNSGKYAVSLSIKDVDTFYDVTNKVSKMTNNTIVIWLDYQEQTDSYQKEKNICGSLSDSRCLSAATVDQAFASDVIIQGNFTKEEVTSLVELINSGALPTKLEEISSRTVEATFGESSLDKTMTAGIIGICLVVILMISIYHFAGLIASVGIIVYTFLSFLVFYLIEGVLTLPGIAAMLLGIGMAVDASVISFERVKDRLKMGESLKQAYEAGNKSSLGSIVDANITTMIVAIILFILGESSVKGFATMLIINIITTILIMVFLSRFLLDHFVKTELFENKISLFIGLAKKKILKSKEVIIPYQNIDFMKPAKKCLIASSLIIIVGFAISFTTKFNLGVDYTGGTSITISSEDKLKEKEFTDYLEAKGYTINKTEISDQEISSTVKETLDKDEISSLSDELETKFNSNTNIYVVSKMVKQQLTMNAIYSVLFAIIGIILYISFRFKFNYAISAVIALVHDVLITIVFFGIFKIEITSIFIAAILTIIGYSINDTVVTFDMIRESYKNKYKNNIKDKKTLTKLVNDSVRLTIFRSIVTTITTILPVICLIVMGAKEIVNFNIALLVGFIAGVYSSIYISNQFWLLLEYRSLTKPKDQKKDKELEELNVKGINC